jgi:hypothetical protein
MPIQASSCERIDEIAPRLEEHVRRKLSIARPGYDEGT